MFYILLFQQVVTIMSRTLHDLVLGELQQLTTKSQRDDRFDTYMKKTYNKTASLMANSCQAVAQMASTASNTGLALHNGTYHEIALELHIQPFFIWSKWNLNQKII